MVKSYFKLSINRHIIGKPNRGDPVNQALNWNSVELDIDKLISEIGFGRAFSAQFKGGHRKSSNFICSDVVAVDIDGGLLLEDALVNPYITSNASFLYTTPSHSESEHRFRIVFLTNSTITSSEDWKNALRGAGRKLGGDPSIKDAARQFYGSKGGSFHRFGNVLSDYELQHLISLGEEVRKEQLNRQLGSRVSVRANPSLLTSFDLKTADGRIVQIKDLPPSTSVYCPVHIDKTPSAFTVKARNGSLGVHCSSCVTTYWYEEPNTYDFEALDNWVKNIDERSDNQTVSDSLDYPFPNSAQVIKLSTQYLPPVNYRDGIICIKSPKGTGKTQALISLVETIHRNVEVSKKIFPNLPRSVLLIGHRQTLLREAASKLGLTCYLDEKVATQFYAVCLDSLYNRFGSRANYDVILIDESEQVLQHLLSETISKGSGIDRCWNVLNFMLRQAKSVIALDADLSLMTIHALKYLRPQDWDSNFQLIYNDPSINDNRTRQFDLYSDRSHLVDELINTVNLRQKVFVTGNSKKFIQSLNETIKEKANRKVKIIEITSDNSRDVNIIEFVRNIKTEILKYDVVLASPSLGTGVDISFPNSEQKIDVVFGFFEALINTHMDIDQQIARVRNPKSIKLWISSRKERLETNFDVVLNDVASAYAVKGAIKGYDDNGNLIFDKRDPLLQIYSHIICSQRASHIDILKNFLELKNQQGWTVNPISKDLAQSQTGKSAYLIGKQNRIQKRVDNLLSAPQLSEDDATELLIKKYNDEHLTQVEMYKLERAIIERSFGTSLTRDLIIRNEDNKLIDKVSLFKKLELSVRQPYDDDIFDYFNNEFIVGESKKKWGIKTGKPHTLVLMFRSIGFLKSTGFDGDVKIEQKNLSPIVGFLKYNRIAIEEAFGFGLRDDFSKNPIRQLNVFLGLVGLSVKKDRKRMKKGKVSYFYKLDPKDLNFMTNISRNFNLFDLDNIALKNGYETKGGNPNIRKFIRSFQKI